MASGPLYTGPLIFNSSGTALTGAALDAQELNCFAIAQSYWMNPTTPTFSTLTLTWSAAPQGVANTSTNALYVTGPLSLTLSGGHGSAQDYYIYLNISGTYTVQNVVANTAYTPDPTQGALLGKATTNSGDNAITSVSIASAVTSPFPTGGMTISGSNSASTVQFTGNLIVPGTLGVTGTSTFTGAATFGTLTASQINGTNENLSGTLSVSGAATLSSLQVNGSTTLNGRLLSTNPGIPTISNIISNGILIGSSYYSDNKGQLLFNISPAYVLGARSGVDLCTVTFSTAFSSPVAVVVSGEGGALPVVVTLGAVGMNNFVITVNNPSDSASYSLGSIWCTYIVL